MSSMRKSVIALYVFGTLGIIFVGVPRINQVLFSPSQPLDAAWVATQSQASILASFERTPACYRQSDGSQECQTTTGRLIFVDGELDNLHLDRLIDGDPKYITPALVNLPCDRFPDGVNLKPSITLKSALKRKKDSPSARTQSRPLSPSDHLISTMTWHEGCGGPLVVVDRTISSVGEQQMLSATMTVYFNRKTVPLSVWDPDNPLEAQGVTFKLFGW